MDRRATASPAPPIRPASPSNVALMNGAPLTSANLANIPQSSQQSSPGSGGFVAVNARPHLEKGASSSTRHELMSKFHTVNERRPSAQPSNGTVDARRPSIGHQGPSHPATPVQNAAKPPSKPAELGPSNIVQQRPPHMSEAELHHVMNSPVPIPNTPSSLLPAASQRAQQPQEKDDGGPFKVEMVHRMESLAKGERILPPCDRCRRLHMDCLKNLTACMGCTKKHAKCSWKEVRESELRGGSIAHPPRAVSSGHHSDTDEADHSPNGHSQGRASTGSPAAMPSPYRPSMTPSHITPAPQQGFSQEPLRMPSVRNSPPFLERERERPAGVEAQLQEAAKSGLAHANANVRLGGTHEGSKPPEFQTLVA